MLPLKAWTKLYTFMFFFTVLSVSFISSFFSSGSEQDRVDLSQQVRRNSIRYSLSDKFSFFCFVEVERKEKQLRGETAARQQLELQLDRLANQVFCSWQRILNSLEEIINGVTLSTPLRSVLSICCLFVCALYLQSMQCYVQ